MADESAGGTETMTTKIEIVLQMAKPSGGTYVDAYAYPVDHDRARMARDLDEMRDSHPDWVWRIVRRETTVVETVVEAKP